MSDDLSILVIPAQAGIQTCECQRAKDSSRRRRGSNWIPACAGMTIGIGTFFTSSGRLPS